MPEQLTIFDDYAREDVQRIFDPGATFTRGAGLWGLRGIVPIPQRPGDFVFFVSFGRSQGDHQFDEGISTEGVLKWQSQPGQTLEDPQIQKLIHHDELTHSIYLFLRTQIRRSNEQLPYTYLGRLKYLAHDAERERPVHFRWQLMNWPIPGATRSRMDLSLDEEPHEAEQRSASSIIRSPGSLTFNLPPRQQEENPEPTRRFRAAMRRIPSEEENRTLGLLGERLVLEHEKANLQRIGRADLAELVRHTAQEDGDGAGFDIRSFFEDGRIKYIEVKTTAGPHTSDFFISANEVAFSRANPAHFELRRLYNYDAQTHSADCYSVFGDLTARFKLAPTQYRVGRLTG